MKRGNTCYLYREKRGSAVMSDDDSKNNIVPLNNNPPSDWNRSNNGSGWKNYFDKQNIISGIISGLIYTAIFTIGAFALNVYSIPEDISDMQTDIKGIESDITRIEKLITDETNNRVNIDTQIQSDIGQVREQISQFAINMAMRPTTESQGAITQGYNDWGSPYANPNSSNQLKATTLIAYSESTNTQYSAQQLADLKLFLPYWSGNQEVYFYGAFNENGQWTGNCITNVYENNKLTLITDAIYDNGKLLQCKQIFAYTLKNGQDVWAFADRTQEDGFSSGVTWLYERTPENEYKKDYMLDEATINCIFTGAQFREKISSHLCAFYHGNISDGFFNDETGDAYMVYFFEDGTVRLLYSGNFKDGTFNDSTGNAWYIVKEKDTDYMYAKGSFKNGKLQRSTVTEKGPPPLSLEDIKGYMTQRNFDFPFVLKWAGFGQTIV